MRLQLANLSRMKYGNTVVLTNKFDLNKVNAVMATIQKSDKFSLKREEIGNCPRRKDSFLELFRTVFSPILTRIIRCYSEEDLVTTFLVKYRRVKQMKLNELQRKKT